MYFIHDVLADFTSRFGHRCRLPEYRQIELYTKKKKLPFDEEGVSAERLPPEESIPGTLATEVAYMLLENCLLSRQPELEDLPGWERYLALPKATATDKLVAEVYRILRIHHLVVISSGQGRLGAGGFDVNTHVDVKEGILRFNCTYRRCGLSLHITPAGIALLESFVLYYLASFGQPYGEAYVEAMLTQYFVDIVMEIKRFADEDRILYQFRHRLPINRHFRFDCDNPRYEMTSDGIRIDVGRRYEDGARYPIDFFIVLDDVLHIIPVEALRNGCLPLTELPAWRARSADGELPAHSLPASFRQRFGREVMVVGLPMT